VERLVYMQRYLEAHQMSVGELLTECIRRLSAGSYTCPGEQTCT